MGTLEWSLVNTPDSQPGLIKEILNPANKGISINKIVIGNNGINLWSIIRRGDRNGISDGGAQLTLLQSTDGGISWDDTSYNNLSRCQSSLPNGTSIWDVAIAPDQPDILVVVCSDIVKSPINQEVWVTYDNGLNWQNTGWLAPNTDAFISAVDISMDVGKGRYILIGTRPGNGIGTDNIQIINIPHGNNWIIQNSANGSTDEFTGDVIAAKFSPTFIVDSTIIVIYSNTTSTNLISGILNLNTSTINWSNQSVELKNHSSQLTRSPDFSKIWNAAIAMPSDFSGRIADLFKVYISTSTVNEPGMNHGVYCVHNNIIHTLMDNTNIAKKAICSIAYWGTCASGKLLAGGLFGNIDMASVPIWFTEVLGDIKKEIYWYPSKKSPSGSANSIISKQSEKYHQGYGNAQVIWSPIYADQGVAYSVTGSTCLGPWKKPTVYDGAIEADLGWPAGYVNVIPLDESAVSLTRNNGFIWNQVGLINTLISKLTDIAVSPDCTTMYLSSINIIKGYRGFDSIWRSTMNERVVPPIYPSPVGNIWERVRVSPTNINNKLPPSKWAIIRLAEDKDDGQVVFWAAGGTSGQTIIGKCPVGANTQAIAWSPDFGEYWGEIKPSLNVQDMVAPTSSILYVIDIEGNLQKLPYTGTEWSSKAAPVYTGLKGLHTVEAMGENVLISGDSRSFWPCAYSSNGGGNFVPIKLDEYIKPRVGVHAIFDTDFNTRKTILFASDAAETPFSGSIYRSVIGGIPAQMKAYNTNKRGFYGLAQTNLKNATRRGTLYAMHGKNTHTDISWSGIERTLQPLMGIPIPGIEWDCLDAGLLFQNQCVDFSLEPKALKICGCLTQDTNVTLYAIDNNWYTGIHGYMTKTDAEDNINHKGKLWSFTDSISKVGPLLTLDDSVSIGSDLDTGKIKDINFTWEQLVTASHYQLRIAKDEALTLVIADIDDFSPFDITAPSLIYFAGEGLTSPQTKKLHRLEIGTTYHWSCRVKRVINGLKIISPWAEVRRFTISDSSSVCEAHLVAKEPSIKYKKLKDTQRKWVKISLVQMDYSLTERFPYLILEEKKEDIKKKILGALEISRMEKVDITCFPELSFTKEWVQEIKNRYKEGIIICGSLYDDDRRNICHIIINGEIFTYAKCRASIMEKPNGVGLNAGNELYVFQTEYGLLSVLTCTDYDHEYFRFSEFIRNRFRKPLDILINPRYDIDRDNMFQIRSETYINLPDGSQSSTIILHINAAINMGKGGTSIMCSGHPYQITRFKSDRLRPDDSLKKKLCEAKGEMILIAEIKIAANVTEERIKLSNCNWYEYKDNRWKILNSKGIW